MLFEKSEPISLLSCETCRATGFIGFSKCKECHGMSAGHFVRGHWLYWFYPLTRYHLDLAKTHRIFNKVRFFTLLLLFLTFWGWAIYFTIRSGVFGNTSLLLNWSYWQSSILNFQGIRGVLFYGGAIILLYLWYRAIVERIKKSNVERYHYSQYENKPGFEDEMDVTDWKIAKKIRSKKKVNIADTFTDEALIVLGEAYLVADKSGHGSVTPEHLFYALLSSNRISNIFTRLGIPASSLQKTLADVLGATPATSGKRDKFSMPLISPDFQQILFVSYEEAYSAHQEYVSVTELLLSTIKESAKLQEILFDLAMDKQKLLNVVEWARIRERLYRQYVKFRKAAGGRSKTGMDKAMTAVQTPFLNNFSDDLTILAQFGNLENCVAREKEIEEVVRIVEGGGQNVILVGDNGVGKTSIIEGLAQKMVEDDVPKRLQDKRLVRLSVPKLLAGTTPAGAVERLIGIMQDIGRAGNVILFINNIHELTGVSAGGETGSLDVAGTLNEYLGSGRFLTFATTTPDEYSRHIVSSPLGNLFAKVEIKEMDENQAIQVLESKVGTIEYKQNVFFSYEAVAKSVQLAARFLHESYLPGSAQELMTEAASFAHTKKGLHSFVTGEEVAAVVAQKTGVPVTTVSADESAKLIHLEEEMHKRVIGQVEAVDLVANALRRARAEIRSSKRPIANFLFLGPTGVGKTELAKTIAEVYFGGEERMVRLDMSEYQDKSSIYRLIGTPGEKGSGMLTEAIRRNPFSLLLLDEMEKADKDILNLFLQVMDDGRLTDSVGRVVDFTNVILIATANAGTAYVQEQLRAGVTSEVIKDKLLHGELKQYFRPEFLNRFDGIVLFKALNREDIIKIAGLMLKRVAKDLEAKGIEIRVEPAAMEFLADVGFDPEFGARPMRRALQEKVENQLAELLLSGKLKRRDTVVIGQGGEIKVV
ncbi:MAG: ATP-dependent Clp protease ATP-binding subunit [Candidatus Magasanikbacteria bacterium]